MPKNSPDVVVTPEAETITEPILETVNETVILHPFYFPSIGNGVVILAKDQRDADEKAARHPLNQH